MKPISQVLLPALVATAVSLCGCTKQSAGDSRQEGPIRGRASDPPVELKAAWKPGNKYFLLLESRQSSEGGGRGPGPGRQETTTAQELAVTVSEAARGSVKLDVEIQSLAVDAFFGDQLVLHFDSLNKAVPNDGPGTEMLEQLVGGKFQVLIKPDNTIARVDGLRELTDRAAAAGGGDTGRRGGMGMGMARRVFDLNSLRQVLELTGYPTKPVRIGDQWPQERSLPAGMMGTLVLKATNTFRGWQELDRRKCARIDFTGAMASAGDARGGGRGGGPMNLEDVRAEGRTWFDATLGFPVETELRLQGNLVGNRPPGPRGGPNAPAAQAGAGGARVSRPMEQTFTVKLKQLEAM
jgi:hypothetical protein